MFDNVAWFTQVCLRGGWSRFSQKYIFNYHAQYAIIHIAFADSANWVHIAAYSKRTLIRESASDHPPLGLPELTLGWFQIGCEI